MLYNYENSIVKYSHYSILILKHKVDDGGIS